MSGAVLDFLATTDVGRGGRPRWRRSGQRDEEGDICRHLRGRRRPTSGRNKPQTSQTLTAWSGFATKTTQKQAYAPRSLASSRKQSAQAWTSHGQEQQISSQQISSQQEAEAGPTVLELIRVSPRGSTS